MNTRTLIILTTVLVLLAGFDYLEAWTKPAVTAPGGNVAAPLNTSSATQDKLGVLGVSALGINSNGPRILFSDMDSNDWWIHTNDAAGGQNIMYFISDRNDDGDWTGENPWPFLLSTDKTSGNSANDYALFSNQVRAKEYCDENGQNCWRPSDLVRSTQPQYEDCAAQTVSYSILNRYGNRSISGSMTVGPALHSAVINTTVYVDSSNTAVPVTFQCFDGVISFTSAGSVYIPPDN